MLSAIAGPVIAPLSAWMAKQKLTNWAGNFSYSTNRLHEAASVDQIQSFVRSRNKVKVLGTRHCFNSIADSRYNLLSLKPMHDVVALDPLARTVTVDAGITYGQLCPYLDSKGFALHNLASLPHISIAGACSTATHGSGEKNGNLATAVSGFEIVTAAGDVVKITRTADGELFRGAVVGLGALGAITRITLDIEPTYAVRQYVYEDLPFAQMKDHFDEIQSSGYSVSLFTDWQKERINEVWIKSRVGDGQAFAACPEFFG
ncbi:MAG: FAD-binding protein, partial [Bryobacteraceae bacterium]